MLITTVAVGQQAGGLTQTPPQPTQPGQIANQQLNTQLQDLSGQPQGTADATQPTQQVPSGQPGQSETQIDSTQPGQQGQVMAPPDPSTARQSGAQPGATGAPGQPGELGVFVIGVGGQGVRINRVASGTAAEAAGLVSGDVIMAINGQTIDQPQELIRLIRAIPAGEVANLRVWRNGQEQELVATLQPLRARDAYQSNFRGESGGTTGDLAQRTQRLEQQLNMVMQELQRLRQEVMQLRSGGAGAGASGLQGQQPNGQSLPGEEPFGQSPTQPGLDNPTAQPGTTDPDTGLPF
jgi:membrane-associated protease RseP (regulator of RpoE activity)